MQNRKRLNNLFDGHDADIYLEGLEVSDFCWTIYDITGEKQTENEITGEVMNFKSEGGSKNSQKQEIKLPIIKYKKNQCANVLHFVYLQPFLENQNRLFHKDTNQRV